MWRGALLLSPGFAVTRPNEAVVDFSLQSFAALPGRKTLWAVGDRVYSHLTDAGLSVVRQFTVRSSAAAITPLVTEIQIEVEAQCAKSQYAQVHVTVVRNLQRSMSRWVSGYCRSTRNCMLA